MTSPSFEFVVSAEWAGLRIDTVLAALLRNHSAARLQRSIRRGEVFLNGMAADRESRVCVGDELRLRVPDPPDMGTPPTVGPLDWRFVDGWCGVLAKPAGTVVHPTGPHQRDTLINRIQADRDRATGTPGLLRPGIVHRLDAETSGALVVAFDGIAHRRLQQQFERGGAKKSYLAIVSGRVTRTITIDAPIGRADSGRHVLMSCEPDAADPRTALTEVWPVWRWPSATLVRCRPRTGRNHQIRVHLASIGHPILADRFYDRAGRFREKRAEPDTVCGLSRHALHAERLLVRHPISGAPLDCVAPVPPDFRNAIACLCRGEQAEA